MRGRPDAKRYGGLLPPLDKNRGARRRGNTARYGIGDSGDPWTKGRVHEREQSKGISEMQQGRRMVDGAAHELPGKEAAGEEEDELGGGDSGLSFAIPWSRTKRATRRTFGWSWIWTGSSQSTTATTAVALGFGAREEK